MCYFVCLQTESKKTDPVGVGLGGEGKGLFLEKVRQSNEAIQRGDFQQAVVLYSEAIALDPVNHILYSNRSAAFVKLGQFQKGLQDAAKARELNPKWSKVRHHFILF